MKRDDAELRKLIARELVGSGRDVEVGNAIPGIINKQFATNP
jgi:hypothetical protein